jgi:hypothetical protein
MSEGVKQNVDTSSAEFKEGVKAGLNSTVGTKNWQAGIKLGQELKDEGENKKLVSEVLKESSTPLFMRGSQGGHQENAQDEKDETEE